VWHAAALDGIALVAALALGAPAGTALHSNCGLEATMITCIVMSSVAAGVATSGISDMGPAGWWLSFDCVAGVLA